MDSIASRSSSFRYNPVRYYILTFLFSFSVGDAACTIASSTCFPEPFETPSDRRRLGWVHKKFAGNRSSDHLALLSAFQSFEDARYDPLFSVLRNAVFFMVMFC